MRITGIQETCLYASNLSEVKSFYKKLPGIQLHSEEPGRHLFFKTGSGMLLVFNPDETLKEGDVPSHGANGSVHAAFAVPQGTMDQWKAHLRDHDIEIEQDKTWPNGTRSLYFRDPAGNSLELITKDLWES
jgi:catechol-2,3-dioxygenase